MRDKQIREMVETLQKSSAVSYEPNACRIDLYCKSTKEKFYVSENNGHLTIDYGILAKDLYNAGAVIIPIKLNQVVYKICPKCNDNHHGSCRHCAWEGCLGYGCEVGVGVWHDGSYTTGPLQLVPIRVVERNFITILKNWNIMYFPTEKAAGDALTEYDAIRGIEEKEERYNAFSEWAAAREVRFSFLEG